MFTYLTPGINRVLYTKYYSTRPSYNEEMRVIYTNFIKALLHNKLNLNKERFEKYEEIIKFLEGFQGDKLFSRKHVSKIKTQGEFERVPLTPKSKEFINYVKRTFNEFDEFEFVLIKPIKGTETVGKVQPTIVQNNATKQRPINVDPKNITESKVVPTIIKSTPASITVGGASKETVTETITKIVEPVVTETITKVVEPVVKVVEPVVKVVETITKPVMDAIPNIIINNANTNSAHATTVTSNTQVASSNWDTLLGILGLKSIAKFIKEIFGLDGDGIIFLLIQLPYLVWFLISLKDNPEIMKYLTDNFGIEEYKAPNTELAPIEYDFTPIDFDSEDDSNDVASEIDLMEEGSRDYTNNSDLEYFDYFDYYHSKPEAIKDNDLEPTSKEVVEELKEGLKDAGSNLLDITKHAIEASSESIKDKIYGDMQNPKQEVHVIDDQFNGAINVFSASKEVQGTDNKVQFRKYSNNSNGTSFGSVIKWLFPMLDFDNLNYYPSYFEKFNMNAKVQPITNKVDYVKMLINELYYTLNLGKFEIPKVNFNLPDFIPSRKGIQSHADTLSALEGLSTKRTPNWRNTDLISDNTSFSTYFNKDWNRSRVGRLPSVNSSPVDILLGNRTSVYSPRTIPSTPSLVIDTKSNVDNSWFYDSPLPSVNSTPIRPLIYSEYFDSLGLQEVSKTTTNALATKLDTKVGIHDLLNIKSAIVEVDTKIVKLKDQFIEFHHKINRFDEQIAELDKQKLKFTEKFNKGRLSASDWDNLNKVKQQLEYINNAKASLEASNNLNNDELKSLEIKKSSLLELKNKYEKLLGNIATTPNV